jgi:hypothetical protein
MKNENNGEISNVKISKTENNAEMKASINHVKSICLEAANMAA